MVKRSSDKKRKLDYRDIKRTRLALRFLGEESLGTAQLKSEGFYRDLKQASLHRTFTRDRDALGKEGIRFASWKEGQSTYFRIDQSSLAGRFSSELDEFSRVVATLARGLLTEPGTSSPRALGSAIVRSSLSTGAGTGIRAATDPTCDQKTLACFEEGLSTGRAVTVVYQAKADAEPEERVFKTYGIFTLAGYTFVVGDRFKEGDGYAIRTYNLDRVKRAFIKSDAESYAVPSTFSLDDHRYLPYEIGEDEATQTARFYIPRSRVESAPNVTRNLEKGTAEKMRGGSVIWSCTIRNTQAAAEWAIENGLIPTEPASLVSAWKSIIEGARQK